MKPSASPAKSQEVNRKEVNFSGMSTWIVLCVGDGKTIYAY